MRTIIRLVISIFASILLAKEVCVVLSEKQALAFDWVCGHNVFLQWPIIFLIVFLCLGLLPWFRNPASTRSH